MVLAIRTDDVERRIDAVEQAKKEREEAIKLDNARKEKYDKELAEKKAAFEEAVDAELAKQAAAAVPAEEAEAEEGAEPKEAPPAPERPEFNEAEFKVEFD